MAAKLNADGGALRPDLLALTLDDLAAMANRGNAKRALRECEAGEPEAQWQEDPDGTIHAQWSDGVSCTLPGGRTLREGQCSCASYEICRHLLRTVLAWQRMKGAHLEDAAAPSGWDPGRIDDATLKRQTDRRVLTRANRLWSAGVLAELLRGAKPSAHFHCPGHTVRLPVPDDLRYAQCSCAQAAPCVHAVLAVRAFRLLAPEASSGIISAGTSDAVIPPAVLEAAVACVRELASHGLAAASSSWRDQARRCAAACNEAELIWPAQILEELATDFERYSARDAAFAPEETAARAGELLLRLEAIRGSQAPVPQAFIRGISSDRDAELGAARMFGLGAQVNEMRHSTRLTVFLQSADTGHVMTATLEQAHDPDGGTLRPYHELARATAVKEASYKQLASGQLITLSGKRTASGHLSLGRARAAVSPQAYAWEQLKAPTLVEDFSELAARLRLLPPASFRPRREAADFHVCPLGGVGRATFDPRTNSITAELHDRAGGMALLLHPWTTRGANGAEALLAALRAPEAPLFVAGHVRASGGQLVIRPAALVLPVPNNSRRVLLPWLEGPDSALSSASGPPRCAAAASRLARYAPAAELAAQLIVNGLQRLKARDWPLWERAITETDSQGYHRMAGQLRRVRTGTDPAAALDLLKLLALARDLA